MFACVSTIVLNKQPSETASVEAEIVFFSFINKEAECWGILARLAWTKVEKPLYFNADFELFRAWQK